MKVSKKLPSWIQSRIDTLEANGYSVFLNYDVDEDTGARVTIMSFYSPDGLTMFAGTAVCNPKDQFVKSEGTAIAFSRCFGAMQEYHGREFMVELFNG